VAAERQLHSSRDAGHAFELARDRGVVVSFDVNHRRTLPGSARSAERARRTLASTDILFVGDDELNLLTDETDARRAADELLGTGPGEVILKRGANGASAFFADGSEAHAPAASVSVADVIGAGDSFVAGYLAARAEGLDAECRLVWGNACAATTVATHGDWEGLPTRAMLEHAGRPTIVR